MAIVQASDFEVSGQASSSDSNSSSGGSSSDNGSDSDNVGASDRSVASKDISACTSSVVETSSVDTPSNREPEVAPVPPPAKKVSPDCSVCGPKLHSAGRPCCH